jgi:hypothetical protein
MNRNALLSAIDHFLMFSSLENGLYDGRLYNLLLSRWYAWHKGEPHPAGAR